MKLPIHRWFRFSAGFSAQWVESLLVELSISSQHTVFDPFAGSGTTLLSADILGIPSVGVEAHPFVHRICQSKLLWATSVEDLNAMSRTIMKTAQTLKPEDLDYPEIIHKCFDYERLDQLDRLRRSWLAVKDKTPASDLSWLALTSILRPSSFAGTAQWQYILPNKTKKVVTNPFEAFATQIESFSSDMLFFQSRQLQSRASVYLSDARECPQIARDSVDIVITSPPYANNYDYADATRFEMSFWGEVESWADLHDVVRKHLIRSSSQHASKDRLELDELLEVNELDPIHEEIYEVCTSLAEERLSHGGKKHYHTMIAAYFVDMARVWHELRRVCKSGATVCFVIGDSAPYGVYVPVDTWLGELALSAGFKSYSFEKLRDRNVKWKNRTHTVPLHEGRLWIQG